MLFVAEFQQGMESVPQFNPNSLDNGSCWILKNFYCWVTMLRELGLRWTVTENYWLIQQQQ